jgi:heme/copper-type cytochrome/quinol oxidase subunit 2
VLIYFVLIFLVIQYRFLLRTRLDYDTFSYANEIELFTSTIITTIIIIILNTASPTLHLAPNLEFSF